MTKKTTVHVVINPASGMKQPILFLLNQALKKHDHIKWSVSVTQQDEDAYTQSREALYNKVDMVAVYGGDGTVVEAARALYNTSCPLAILPGGSANVVAKDLGIPMDISQAIVALLAPTTPNVRKVDMAELNGNPLFLHVSVGLFADFVKETSRELKNLIGQAAYGVTLSRILRDTPVSTYTFSLDGQTYKKDGVGLYIANAGNMGTTSLQFEPEIDLADGKLDVIFVKEVSVSSINEFVQNVLFKKPTSQYIDHWRASRIQIEATEDQTVSSDDRITNQRNISLSVVPQSLQVIVP
jgi:YegS/Rv2252/BmrU family lipid kinase